jgi:hypothetical protein
MSHEPQPYVPSRSSRGCRRSDGRLQNDHTKSHTRPSRPHDETEDLITPVSRTSSRLAIDPESAQRGLTQARADCAGGARTPSTPVAELKVGRPKAQRPGLNVHAHARFATHEDQGHRPQALRLLRRVVRRETRHPRAHHHIYIEPRLYGGDRPAGVYPQGSLETPGPPLIRWGDEADHVMTGFRVAALDRVIPSTAPFSGGV